MAEIRIIPEDGVVGVNGVFRTITLANIDPAIHAVQWDEDIGFIEYTDARAVQVIAELGEFQRFVDVWTLNTPPEAPPLTGNSVLAAEVADLFVIAAAVVEAARIAALVDDSLLPEAVAYKKAKAKLDKLL